MASAIDNKTLVSDMQEPSPQSAVGGLTLRALIYSLIFTWLCGYWVRQAEIIVLACQITESVPAIPGVAALISIMVLNPILKKTGIFRPFSLGETLVIFLFVTVASTMMGPGIGRFLIATIGTAFYYSEPAAPLETLQQYFPTWMVPSEPWVYKAMYEGSLHGQVPWESWIGPIAVWMGFFGVFALALYSIVALFSDQWIDKERLTFPLVRLPLEVLQPPAEEPPFLRNKIAWFGIIAAVLLNGVSMIRALFFGTTGSGLSINLTPLISEPPWRSMGSVQAILRPELIGLGYIVSTEMSFSIWFFYVLQRFAAMFMSMGGLRLSGIPFEQEQSIGVYLALALVLVYKGRPYLIEAWRELIGISDARRSHKRWALLGAIVGLFSVYYFFVATGMEPWLAALYLAILAAVALVYARVRAETGIPLIWAFPYGMQHKIINYALGGRPLVATGAASMTMFGFFNILSRGYFPTVSAYAPEGIRMGQETNTHRKQMAFIIVAAVMFGIGASFYFHLVPFYERGAAAIRGGIWGTWDARASYTAVLRAMQTPFAADAPRTIAAIVGMVIGFGLTALRSYWFGCPFHPLGYAASTAFGRILWANFFIVWLVKVVILRYGSNRTYIKARPAFLGFVLGHFVVSGVIWGTLGALVGGIFLRYVVYFG